MLVKNVDAAPPPSFGARKKSIFSILELARAPKFAWETQLDLLDCHDTVLRFRIISAIVSYASHICIVRTCTSCMRLLLATIRVCVTSWCVYASNIRMPGAMHIKIQLMRCFLLNESFRMRIARCC